MKLCTECHWDGWDRIVDIYPERCDILPEYINDKTTYKILILEKGAIEVTAGREKFEVSAPALITLNQKDRFEYRILKNIKALILYFNPTVIREEFTCARIDSGEFESTMGKSIFQDYLLVEYFTKKKNISDRVISLTMNGLKRMKEYFNSAENELLGQRDGFWPCRSRSYLMEMLYFIMYSYIEVAPESYEDAGNGSQEEFSKIAEYLNENIDKHITLEILTKEFAINRNKLNALFMEQSSMTCLGYLLSLRLDLAKILLTKTELPVNEISARVGYPDPNYFTKIFRNATGKTPSQYRKDNSKN